MSIYFAKHTTYHTSLCSHYFCMSLSGVASMCGCSARAIKCVNFRMGTRLLSAKSSWIWICASVFSRKIVNWIDYDMELSFKCFHVRVNSIYIGQLDVLIVVYFRDNIIVITFNVIFIFRFNERKKSNNILISIISIKCVCVCVVCDACYGKHKYT